MEQVSRIELVEIERTQEPVTLVETEMAQAVVDFGRSKGWTFKILPYRGYLYGPVGNSEWTYEPYTNQPLIKEAEQRLFDIGCQVGRGVRIEQVIYAHEVEEPLPDISWQKVATTVGVVAGAIALGFVAMAALVLEDPALIVVLDDEENTWVQICSWI